MGGVLWRLQFCKELTLSGNKFFLNIGVNYSLSSEFTTENDFLLIHSNITLVFRNFPKIL